jgi:hypothetical protein
MLARRMLLSSVATILLLESGCEKSPTGPELIKDPRTYTFTVDTIAYLDAGQTNLYDIAGTSANNVYAVGFNSSYSAGTMFRFDGARWKSTGFHMSEGGPISGSVDFNSLLAFSSDNIWFVGDRSTLNPNPPPNFIDSSLILHYDGNSFTEYKAYGGSLLSSVHGIAPKDIWVCGVSKTLFHYNGVTWERDSIPVAVPPNGGIILRDIRAVSAQTVYLIGFGLVVENNVSRITYHYFLQLRENRWAVVDSFPDSFRTSGADKWGFVDLWATPSGNLYSLGPTGIWRWNEIRWIKMLDWNGGPLQRIWGYSDHNFFVSGYRTLLHYNGTDFYQYPSVTGDMVYWGIWGSGNELFVVGNDGSKSYVFHGR